MNSIINAQSLTHATLQRLRQAETLPLAQLCKQVQRENYQDWRTWERSLDYTETMQGRYPTLFEEQVRCPTRQSEPTHTTLPLFARKVYPVDLLKLTISKDALIPKETLHALLPEHERVLLPAKRAVADNVRKALAYRLRPWQRFNHNGAVCRVERTSTTGGGLDEWIYVQHRTTTTVAWDRDPVCQITLGGTHGIRAMISPTGYAYQDLLSAIDADTLADFGERHYFESDVRNLAQALLEDVCVPFWAGVLLALTPEAHETAKRVQEWLAGLVAGSGKVSLMSLDNTPANREALGRELAEGFIVSLDKLTERCGYQGPMLEKIQADYDALSAKIALAESVLGLEIDCLESQVNVELALSAAQAA